MKFRQPGRGSSPHAFRLQRFYMNIHVFIIRGAQPLPIMVPACRQNEQIIGMHFITGVFLHNPPASIKHIQEIMLVHNPVRMRRGVDKGYIIGRTDAPRAHQLKISAHIALR